METHHQVVGAMRAGGGEFPERVGQPVCQVYSPSTFYKPLNMKKLVSKVHFRDSNVLHSNGSDILKTRIFNTATNESVSYFPGLFVGRK